ncbi:MAG: hypothetical protein JW889_10015 [Verrucomicrobia bacterium]|nr:hypothetical protein [Verrucomicrobiota bacterium]
MRTALLIAGGVLNCALMAFHVSFWRFRRLNWRVELPRSNAVNRGAIQVMNLMLIYAFVCFAAVSFVMAAAGASRAMLNAVGLIVGGFYMVRAALQFVFFETTAFSLVFVGVCVVTAACYFGAMA